MPHVCGDEPGCPSPALWLVYVCPTYVGMNRNDSQILVNGVSMPHVCGDEPNRGSILGCNGEYAPRMWG